MEKITSKIADARTRIFEIDSVIPARPNLTYFIEQGAVKIYVPEEEREENYRRHPRIIDFIPQGTSFRLLEDIECVKTVCENTKIVWYNESHLQDLIKLREKVNGDINASEIRSRALNRILTLEKTETKIYNYLKFLSSNSVGNNLINFNEEIIVPKDKSAENFDIVPKILQEEIAGTIGTTRVTVTRLITELRKEGKVCYTKNGLMAVER